MNWFFLFLIYLHASTLIAGTHYFELLGDDVEHVEQEVGPNLLGKHAFDPKSAEYAVRAMLISEMTASIERFPEIAFEQLQEVTDISEALIKIKSKGFCNGGIFEGKWKGRKVILKLANRFETSLPYFIRENFNLLLINQLGLGPEYFGWTQTPQGMAMVMEKVEGLHFRHGDQEVKKLINAQTIEDFIDIYLRLALAGIYPDDYQLIITKEGRLQVIDVGNYGIWEIEPPELTKAFEQIKSTKIFRPDWKYLLLDYFKSSGKIHFATKDGALLKIFEKTFAEKVKLERFDLDSTQNSPLQGLTFASRESFRESFRKLHGKK